MGAFLILALILTSEIHITANKSDFPNQIIWNSIKNCVFFTLFWFSSWFLLRDWLWYWHEQYLWFYSTLVGAYCGLLVAGSILPFSNTYIQHFVLRLFLCFTGSIPWKYDRFLNYATERLLLQRVGRRYKFVHDLLKQSFMNQWMDTQPSINRLQAITNRGRLYQARKQLDKVLQDLSNLIESDSNHSEVFARRGEIYQGMERYEEALKDFDRAIELYPKNDWAIGNRGETYRLMERYEEALQDFDRAIELNLKNDWAIRYRGYTYLILGRFDEALKDLDFAIELNAEYDFRFYHRVLTYFALHQSDLAEADLDIAIRLAQQKHTEKPANCRNTFNLALYHLVAGNLPSAKRFYQIALQHNASPANIRDALQDLEDLLKVLGDVPYAKQMIDFLMQNK